MRLVACLIQVYANAPCWMLDPIMPMRLVGSSSTQKQLPEQAA